MATFKRMGRQFMYNDQPVQLISGAIHYFRVVPEYWHDRLYKLKACGCNTVETYVPWNFHEPKEGVYHFEGMADIVRFIRIAENLDLYVIVRPSPYICAEWEFGGLPAWLLQDKNMELRCSYPPFLEKVEAYYNALLPKLKPLLCTNNGPIIAVQIENEYGSYGNDEQYLQHLKQQMIHHDIDVLLFTSDGPTDGMLQSGSIEDVFATVNFGSQPKAGFDKLEQYQAQQPWMCMEYWNGWFDHWGEKHHTRDANDAARVLDDMLAMGASVNFYMFHGGTNFGFYNGANCFEKYEPTVTSYDYDAALNETGQPTEKFDAFREVISRYTDQELLPLPEPIPIRAYGQIQLDEHVSLFDILDEISQPVLSPVPLTMEQLGQDYGFVGYATFVEGPRTEHLFIQDVHDRALVFVDRTYQGVMERNSNKPLTVKIPEGGATLFILVENMGRVNYGPYLRDYKGITEGVRFGNQFLHEWTMYPLPLHDTDALPFPNKATNSTEHSPAFYRGRFEVDEIADTFVHLPGWDKGVVFVNGFNLGRYWHVGPQRSLYLPGPLLTKGENEIVVFELHGCPERVISFQAEHDLG